MIIFITFFVSTFTEQDQGLAWHYKKYQGEQSVEDRETYGVAEVEAREKQLGLWKSDKPMTPWEWRRR
jgi:endonuclease YncB( thermonuclease family)